jgi:hypothetical protein
MISRVNFRAALLTALCLCASLAAAQVHPGTPPPAAKARKPAAFRSECVASVGLCVNLPSSWQRLGEVFNDQGFVAAELHAGADPETWPQLTVASFQPPAQQDSDAAPSTASPAASLDALVDLMLTPTGALASAETLQRSRLLLNGSPAQTVRVQFHDESGHASAVEEVALIQGEEGLVYSIALRCAPQEFDRLDPVFQQSLQSWRLQSAAGPPAPLKKAPAKKPASTSAQPPASPHPAQAQPSQKSAAPQSATP